MDPIAFHIGPQPIRWYGVMVALAFLGGFYFVQVRAVRSGFGASRAADLSFMAMVGGIVGGRLLYVAMYWSEFRHDLVEILRIDHGGLVFYGGFLGGLSAVVIASRLRHWSLLTVGDLLAPVLPLAHAIGRVGCFLNGCCFGGPWQGGGAVRYPPSVSLHSGETFVSSVFAVQRHQGLLAYGATECLPVFPVQLVAAGVNVAICAALLVIEPRLKRQGQLFAYYLLLYTAGRFFTEFGRGDYLNTFGPFTPAQAICFALFPCGLCWLFWARRRAPLRSP